MVKMDTFDIFNGSNQVLPDDLDENKLQRKNCQFKNDELFHSLKSLIDYQFKLNQLNQGRIRSFEKFRRYCQTVTRIGDGSKFDLEKFQQEYNRFDRNYRYWRKRIQKLRKQTTKSALLNPYDTLYELFVKLERSDRFNINESNKSNNQNHSEDLNCSELSTSITKHESEVPNYIEGNFCCFIDGCDRTFNSKDNFLDHLFEHSINFNQKIKKTKQVNKKRSSNTSAEINTPISTRRTRSQTVSKSDTSVEKNSTKISVDKEKTTISKKTKKLKINKNCVVDIPIVLSCDYEHCTYVAKNLSILKIHKAVHSDLRPFQCDRCEMAFKYKGLLKTHQIGVHEGKRYECPFEGCQTKLSTAFRLRQHIEIVHTKDPPKFQCPVEGCNYSTVRKEFLRDHSAVHSDERPYRCMWPGCLKAFKRSKKLNDHLLIHKNERQFKCKWPDCSFTCNTSNNLRKHHVLHEKKKMKMMKDESSSVQNHHHDPQPEQSDLINQPHQEQQEQFSQIDQNGWNQSENAI